MYEKYFVLFGIVGPLVAYLSIALSISLSPWFSWRNNALSDLGHSTSSDVAYIFNLGLMLAGFLILVYSIKILKKRAKYTSISLGLSAFFLQLISTFDELYGHYQYFISVAFFISIIVSSIIYSIEKRSLIGFISVIIGLLTWTLHFIGLNNLGIAVPETISSAIVSSWIIFSAVEILLEEHRISNIRPNEL
jgi:hypothetical membrane protein